MSEDSTPTERDSGAVRLVHPGERVGVHKGAEAGHGIRRIDGELVAMRMGTCLLYTSPSPRDRSLSRMPSSA